MQMFKKTVAMILSILMLLSVFSVAATTTAFADGEEYHKVTFKSTQGLFNDYSREYKAGDTFTFTLGLQTQKYIEDNTISVTYDGTQIRVAKVESPYTLPDPTTNELDNEFLVVISTATSPVDTRNGGDYLKFTGKIKNDFNKDQTINIDMQTLSVADFNVVVDPDFGDTTYNEINSSVETLVAWSAVEQGKGDLFSATIKATGGREIQPDQPDTSEPPTTEPPTTEPPTTEPPTTEPPTTEPPTTEPPTTEPPTTEPPTTEPPTTEPPTTEPPTTEPTTAAPEGKTATLSAADFTTGEELWYAYTWNSSDIKWVKLDENNTATGLYDDVIFVRINPDAAVVPSWDAKWNQTDDLTTVDGGTFVVTSWDGGTNGNLDGYWEEPEYTEPDTEPDTTAPAADAYNVTFKSQQGLFADMTKTYKPGDTFAVTINLKTKKYTELNTISIRYDDTQLRVGTYETPYTFPDAEFSEVTNERILVWSTATSPVDTREGGVYVTFKGKIKDAINADQDVIIDFQTLGVADYEKVIDPDFGDVSYKEDYSSIQDLIAWSEIVSPDDFEVTASVEGGVEPTEPTTAEETTEGTEPTTAQDTTEATEPTTEATEPTTEATEPTTAQDTTEATEPTTGVEPTTESVEPTTESVEPTTETAEPTTEATEPTTVAPTDAPTQAPTQAPTVAPTQAPTQAPTKAPAKINSLSGKPNADSAVNYVKALKNDKDPKGSTFGLLRANSKKVTKKSIKVTWTKVKGAKKYIIMGNKCGKSYKKLKTTTKKTFTQKKLKKGTYYKYMILAVNSKNKVIAVSKTLHVATSGGKVGNFKSVKFTNVKKSTITLKKGKKFTIKAKAVKGKLKVKNHRKVKFESSNTKVVKVTNKGKITAKKKGTAIVYAYAQNGVYKKVKVKVK